MHSHLGVKDFKVSGKTGDYAPKKKEQSEKEEKSLSLQVRATPFYLGSGLWKYVVNLR